MHTFFSAAKRFATDEEGVTAIEYGLIAALIAVVVGAGFTTIGDKLKLILTSITGYLTMP